jgi:hypothetical protein
MTCESVEEQLSSLIDNELDPETSDQLARHLRSCAACGQVHRELQALVRSAAELEPLLPPDRLFLDIRRQTRRIQHRPWFAPRWVGWVFVPAVATVVLMLVLFPRPPTPSRPAGASGPVALETPSVATPAEAPARPEATRPEAATASLRPARPTRAVRTAPRLNPPERGKTGTPPEAGSVPIFPAATEQPADIALAPGTDAIAVLHDLQQGLEEIEAALYANPGNPQVTKVYHATYQKGVELHDHYLVGTR